MRSCTSQRLSCPGLRDSLLRLLEAARLARILLRVASLLGMVVGVGPLGTIGIHGLQLLNI